MKKTILLLAMGLAISAQFVFAQEEKLVTHSAETRDQRWRRRELQTMEESANIEIAVGSAAFFMNRVLDYVHYVIQKGERNSRISKSLKISIPNYPLVSAVATAGEAYVIYDGISNRNKIRKDAASLNRGIHADVAVTTASTKELPKSRAEDSPSDPHQAQSGAYGFHGKLAY